MKELNQETESKLTKPQLQNVINDHIQNENELNEVFAMMINGLMYSERQVFLGEDQTEGNKGNGYRMASRSGIGSRLQIKIPRDRMGVFRPVILFRDA
ncbi:MAG: transposase [Bacteroidetes bacterium]|nr:transposase [Bacteroidota bacterium]